MSKQINVYHVKTCCECDKTISGSLKKMNEDHFCDKADSDPDNAYLQYDVIGGIEYEAKWFDNNHYCNECSEELETQA